MKTTKLPAALAALLIPSLLFASTVEVTFDAALTNETGWVYSSDIKCNGTGYYVGGHNAKISSPRLGFAVTSVVLRVKTTNSCTRNLVVSALNPETSATDLSQTFENIPQGKDRFEISAVWDASQEVTAIAVESNEGSQNLYFLSATISGVPIVPPPSELHAGDVGYNRFTLSWVNPEGAVSNRIDVFKVLRSEATGATIEDFGFDEISAGGNPKDFEHFRGSLPPHYEKLSGSKLYAAANSVGLLMISTGKDRGMLVHSGFDSYAGLTLCMTLKRYDGDANTMTVGWTNGDAATNLIATVGLGDEFATEFISLSEADDGAMLVFNYSGNVDNHRVIIDEMSFIRGYSPAHVATNFVKSVFATGSPARVGGLSPSTEYIVTVSAFDADGNESRPSDPLRVETSDEGVPLSVRIR